MKSIPIGHGLFATVDDEDYAAMSCITWHVQKGIKTNYAATNMPRVGGGYSTVGMHRMINKTPDGLRTDHRDGNGLNNTRSNLRTATAVQNGQNRAPNSKGSSKYKGVHWHRKASRWRAEIRLNGRLHHLGLFLDERKASAAYNERAKQEFGEFYRSEN